MKTGCKTLKSVTERVRVCGFRSSWIKHTATFKTEKTRGGDWCRTNRKKVKQATEGKLSCQISRRGDAKLADGHWLLRATPTHLNCCFPLCFSPAVALTGLKKWQPGGEGEWGMTKKKEIIAYTKEIQLTTSWAAGLFFVLPAINTFQSETTVLDFHFLVEGSTSMEKVEGPPLVPPVT